jgi:hypothetical protein
MPNVIMLNIIMPNVVMLNVIMLNVIMLNVIMPNIIMLNVVMLSVIMIKVIMLSVVMLNVTAPSSESMAIKIGLNPIGKNLIELINKFFIRKFQFYGSERHILILNQITLRVGNIITFGITTLSITPSIVMLHVVHA